MNLYFFIFKIGNLDFTKSAGNEGKKRGEEREREREREKSGAGEKKK